MNLHLTQDELQDYLDGGITGPEKPGLERHLEECRQCRSTYRALQEVDRSLRTLPSEKAGERFTAAVMSQIPLRNESSFGFRILERLPHVFALFVVLTVLIVVFWATGVINLDGSGTREILFQELAEQSKTGISDGISRLGEWLTTYLPFAFGSATLGITGAILVVVLVLGLIDALVARRLANRIG